MWFYFRKRDLLWAMVKSLFSLEKKETRKMHFPVEKRPGIAKVRKPMSELEKNFVIPVLLTIPATSYEEAMKEGQRIVDDMSSDAGVGVELETYFEHDNIGQRVLYLHPEEDPDYDNIKDEDDNDD
jgi:hypothetical protein